MTPAHQRTVFAGFGLLLAGVIINVALLQPAPTSGQSAGRAAADVAQAKLEIERRQRLALDRLPATAAVQTAAVAPKPFTAFEAETSKPAAAAPPWKRCEHSTRCWASTAPRLSESSSRTTRALRSPD